MGHPRPIRFFPIGNSSTKFEGEYDGQDYTISNLYIDRSSTNDIALFGFTDGSVIENIGIVDVDVTGNYRVGGLVGSNLSSSTISNSYVTGDVSGNWLVGGLAGYNFNSDISNSYATGDITGALYVGGLLGINSNSSTISNSYATGDVSGSGNYVGGLVGVNDNSDISNSYAMGDVTRSSGTNTNNGGFCGYNNSSDIEYCYSTGSVFYTGNPDPSDKGFVGQEGGTNTYTNNFFDSEASNQNTDAVGAAIPKTTAEMKSALTFLNANWDFLDETDNGTDDYWGINDTDNSGYPWLEWQGFTNNLGILPEISTNNVQIIGNEQAQSGGTITDEGASSITAKGLVWNTSGTPTLSDNSTDEGGGSSDFTSLMDNLDVNQTYYVRAYATNSYGTGYGNEKTFVYTAIPTLPEWGLIVLGSLVAIFGIRKIMSVS